MKKLWNNKTFDINTKNTYLSKDLLKKYLDEFWSDVVNNINLNEHILFIPRLILIDNQFVSLSKMLKINKTNKDGITSFLLDLIDLSNESYKNIPIKSIIFSYGVRKGKIINEFPSTDKTVTSQHHIFYKNKLPIGVIPSDYGKIIMNANNTFFISPFNLKNIYITLQSEGDINKIKYIKNGNVLFTWTDTIVNKEEKLLIRTLGKSTIHFKDGEIILQKQERKTTGITNKILPKNNNRLFRFITMDLETVLVNNIHIPYLLCWYDGRKSYSYFLDCNPTTKIPGKIESHILNMISNAMKDINRKKYKGYRIYLHNFAKFDGYFLLKYLSQIGDTSPTIHKGRIISSKFTLNNSFAQATRSSAAAGYEVTFMDSLLMLPVSLRKLCDSFNVETVKSIFPFKLMDINYNGPIPEFKLFDKISLIEYDSYKELFKGTIWNFKEEAIKYCNIDCISLYQILSKFNRLIFNNFKINIIKYPTLSSLAFGIFRTHFLVKKEDVKKDTKGNPIITPSPKGIHMLSGKIAENIRIGYTGGAVDMFIPIAAGRKDIYAYDVNSLYPFVMREYPYPIGTPTYFIGNILKLDPNAFGFFYCKIQAPRLGIICYIPYFRLI